MQVVKVSTNTSLYTIIFILLEDRAFTRNYEFNAPSAASAVVLGHTSNGNLDWKTADGTKLKEL